MGESGGARSALHRTLSERAPLRTDTATSAEKERARSVLSYRPRERSNSAPRRSVVAIFRRMFLSVSECVQEDLHNGYDHQTVCHVVTQCTHACLHFSASSRISDRRFGTGRQSYWRNQLYWVSFG